MVAIKDLERPRNCIECNHMDLQQAINCQLIYSGCANCGRHPNCPLVEIGTCKDCKHSIYAASDCYRKEYYYCKKYDLKGVDISKFYCADFENRGDSDGSN